MPSAKSGVGGPRGCLAGLDTYATAETYTARVTVTDTAALATMAPTTVAVQVNFVGNPGFETGTSGWDTGG